MLAAVVTAGAMIAGLAACEPVVVVSNPGHHGSGGSGGGSGGSGGTVPGGSASVPVPHGPAKGEWTLAGGVILPNHNLTPGATNPAVTQANIGSTICRHGYTKTIRPPEEITSKLKRSQLDSGYTYHGDTSTRDYEEDHLISLEIGGAPSDPRNLWPEPYRAQEGARVKDHIENKLHALVCEGRISLATAQRDIATNWWAAYQRYLVK
jgi:hypothetical protein